jgi:hypothetical protein
MSVLDLHPHYAPMRGAVLRPNVDLLGTDAVLWSAEQRNVLFAEALGGERHRAGEGSLIGVTEDLLGTSASWSRVVGAGINFGTMRPLNNDGGWSVLAIGAPVSEAIRRNVFSQRSDANAREWGFYWNAGSTQGSVAGAVTLYASNSSGVACSVTATAGGIDGLPHCWGAGNSSSSSSGYIHRDGEALTLTTNASLTGSFHDGAQLVRIGNKADFTTDGSHACNNPLSLVIAWPRRLPPAEMAQLTLLLSREPWLALQPVTLALPKAAGGAATEIGQVSETDTALALQSQQGAALGLAQETDDALPITGLSTLALGQSSETDSALPLVAAQAATLGLPTETDSALPIAGGTAQVLGLASETDAALALSSAQAAQLGLATEADTALALAAAQQATFGLATETDTALDITLVAPGAIGIASEADEALPLAGAQVAAVGLAQEADTALQLSPLQATVLGLVLEIDAGLAITMQQAGALGLPVETDDAIALAAGADEPTPIAERTWQIPVDVRVWTMPRT